MLVYLCGLVLLLPVPLFFDISSSSFFAPLCAGPERAIINIYINHMPMIRLFFP